MKNTIRAILGGAILFISLSSSSVQALEVPKNPLIHPSRLQEVANISIESAQSDPTKQGFSKGETFLGDDTMSAKSSLSILEELPKTGRQGHDPKEQVDIIQFQLNRLKFDSSGNNALFIGRTQEQGADYLNLGFLKDHSTAIVNDQTKWFFLDAEQRKKQSPSDIILNTHDLTGLISTETIPNYFSNKFKLIVIDSGVAGYILTNSLLDQMYQWVTYNPESMIIFENPPSEIYTTCPDSPGPSSLPQSEREERWAEGKPLQNNFPDFVAHLNAIGLSLDDLRIYPYNEAVLGQLIIRTPSCNDNAQKVAFRTLIPQIRAYFDEMQKEKIHRKLSQYFENVKLVKNQQEDNSAPFVKGRTFYPALNFFWWVASGKIENSEFHEEGPLSFQSHQE